MATSASLINNLLNAAFRGATYTGGVITMGLYTGNIPSAGGTELAGGSYARQTVTFPTPATGKAVTASETLFSGLPTGQTIVAYAIFSAGVQIDEAILNPSFTADVTTNELRIAYSFSGT